MNTKIKNVQLADYDGVQSVTWELNNLSYFATRKYDAHGDTVSCVYGRRLPQQYYETIAGLMGKTAGMMNKQVSCEFGNLPVDIFENIRAIR